MSIDDQFELVSGAKVNRGKSEAMFFWNWADQCFIPFTVRTHYLKMLGIWFEGVGACAKSWEECIAKDIHRGKHQLYLEGHQLHERCCLVCLKKLAFQNKELTSNECCRLAHSKVQDYMLRDALKLRAAATRRCGEQPLSE
eukprot:g32786.t1